MSRNRGRLKSLKAKVGKLKSNRPASYHTTACLADTSKFLKGVRRIIDGVQEEYGCDFKVDPDAKEANCKVPPGKLVRGANPLELVGDDYLEPAADTSASSESRPTQIIITRDQAEAGRFFDAGNDKTRQIMSSKDPIVLASGPAGTGKTRTILEKIRATCLRFPGIRWLLVRSVRKWLTQSALVTWEEKVIVPGDLIPDRIRRDNRSEYRFKNGSVVVVAGLDDPQQVMSAEYDGIFIVEATEVSQATAETAFNRLRNGRMPYQQLIMDCNPTVPTHWLKREADAGRLRHIETIHKDNPAYYDHEAGRWTKAGESYMAILDRMTGSRKLRLKDGKWTTAEGIIYDEWSPAVNVVERFAIPKGWQRFWVVDFGYTNPFVWQNWAEDGDGRLYLIREIYQTQKIVAEHATRIKALTENEPRPTKIICDHDAEGRATLEKELGMITHAADKNVAEGIQCVMSRVRPAGDGQPRIFMFRDALDEADASLESAGKPQSTLQEIDGYVWAESVEKKGNANKKGDTPLKLNDHGMDAMRYLCMDRDHGASGSPEDIKSGGSSMFDSAPDGIFGGMY
jgi:PBSX family phage terminase large subunit